MLVAAKRLPNMRASIVYRISSVLILLFAIGHTIGFRETDPAWGLDQTLAALKQITFVVQGFHRNYYDFYVGSGFFVTVLMLFTVILTWQLGRLPATTLAQLPWLTWGLALCYGGAVLISWRYFFTVQLIFSSVIFLCLAAAAEVARRNQ
jgi:hypothetical protein